MLTIQLSEIVFFTFKTTHNKIMLIMNNFDEKEQSKTLFYEKHEISDKKANLKVINTKRKLSKSLISLLTSKSITEIDVSELCEKAGINRTTFYKHYASLYHLLDELIVQFFKRIETLFLSLSSGENTTSKVAYLLKYLKQNREFVTIIMNNNSFSSISERLIQLNFICNLINSNIQYRKNDYVSEDYYVDFIISGWIAAIRRWVNENCDLDVNTLARLLTSIY